MYSKYLELICQDENAANDTLLLLSSSEDARTNIGDINKLTGNSSSDGDGMLSVSANSIFSGIVLHCSAGFSRISGYQLTDIKSKPMNILLPKIYHEVHSKIFKEESYYCENGVDRLTKRPPIETFLVAKSQFIIPVIIRWCATPHFLNSYCFIIKVKLNKNNASHDVVHLLASTNKEIVNYTSSKLTIFFSKINKYQYCLLIIDALYLGMSLENGHRNEIFTMDELIPGINGIPENEEEMIYWKKTSLDILTISRYVKCKWRKILFQGEIFLGFHIIVTFQNSTNEVLSLTNIREIPLAPKIQFLYHEETNNYYVGNPKALQSDLELFYEPCSPPRNANSSRSKRRQSVISNGLGKIMELEENDNLSDFSRPLLARLENFEKERNLKYQDYPGWFQLKEQLRSQQKYSHKVVTYRIATNGFVEVKSTTLMNMLYADISISESANQQRRIGGKGKL